MAVNQQLSKLFPPNLSTVDVPNCHNPRPAKLHFKLKNIIEKHTLYRIETGFEVINKEKFSRENIYFQSLLM